MITPQTLRQEIARWRDEAHVISEKHHATSPNLCEQMEQITEVYAQRIERLIEECAEAGGVKQVEGK
jgi:predicted metal-dependent hydrolase